MAETEYMVEVSDIKEEPPTDTDPHTEVVLQGKEHETHAGKHKNIANGV